MFLLLILGFPVALIIAWAFELTPEGIKRAEAVDESEKRSRGAVWIYVVVIAAVLSGGLFVLGCYSAQRSISNEVGAGKRLPATQVNQPISEKSLAVLPFANLSGNPENAYFAAGIQDEIITRLAKIGQLKVISCLSTQRFKSAPDDLPAIANQLGVANILPNDLKIVVSFVRLSILPARTSPSW